LTKKLLKYLFSKIYNKTFIFIKNLVIKYY